MNLHYSFPASNYVQRFSAFFQHDREIRINYDVDNHILDMYCAFPEKAEALKLLLPHTISTDGIFIYLNINCDNQETVEAQGKLSDIYTLALKNNPIVSHITTKKDEIKIFFHDEIVSYYDAANNYMDAALYQDIAKEIFYPSQRVIYCTQLTK